MNAYYNGKQKTKMNIYVWLVLTKNTVKYQQSHSVQYSVDVTTQCEGDVKIVYSGSCNHKYNI